MVIRMIKIQGIRGQNPGNGFWIRENPSLRVGQNPRGKIRATHFGLGKRLTHRALHLGAKIWTTDFGLGKPIMQGGKIRGAKSGQRIWNSENHSPTRGQNPGGKIRGAKSGGQNPGCKIRATDLELGKTKHRGNPGGAKSEQRIWNSEIQTPTLIM